jgi:hypothetical protein
MHVLVRVLVMVTLYTILTPVGLNIVQPVELKGAPTGTPNGDAPHDDAAVGGQSAMIQALLQVKHLSFIP